MAEAVVQAATLRVLRFGPANQHGDWNTVHHTLTYANAVAEGLRRVPRVELFQGVLDAAGSIWLDRFLNLPPARLPVAPSEPGDPESQLAALGAALDGRSDPAEATSIAWGFLMGGGQPEALLSHLGTLVLREDAGFHELQQLELAWRRLQRCGHGEASRLSLAACARWVSAQFPTRRAAEQTYRVAERLAKGEALHA